MRITLEADYAVRIIDFLARARKRVAAREIAEHTGVTLRFTLKILRELSEAGLVCSYKGVKGGYALSREPEKISMKDVIEAVDGPITIGRCLDGCLSREETRRGPCVYLNIFADISQMVREKLAGVTFKA